MYNGTISSVTLYTQEDLQDTKLGGKKKFAVECVKCETLVHRFKRTSVLKRSSTFCYIYKKKELKVTDVGEVLKLSYDHEL